jgi:hypothetical protein
MTMPFLFIFYFFTTGVTANKLWVAECLLDCAAAAHARLLRR